MIDVFDYNTFRARFDQKQKKSKHPAVNATINHLKKKKKSNLFWTFSLTHLLRFPLTRSKWWILVNILNTITSNNKSNVFDVKCQTFHFVFSSVISLKLTTKANVIVPLELIFSSFFLLLVCFLSFLCRPNLITINRKRIKQK